MLGYHRKKLSKILGASRAEDFLTLLWAADALQSENYEAALRFLDHETVPYKAINARIPSKFAIHKWELETLLNELMTTPKQRIYRRGAEQRCNCRNFSNLLSCVNILRKIENLEYRKFNKKRDIHVEMGRIAARQINWQRNPLSSYKLYRSAYIYGGDECGSYFVSQYGLSIERFMYIGFLLHAWFLGAPSVRRNCDLTRFGVNEIELKAALSLFCLPYNEASKLARRQRKNRCPVAYKPSIARQYPCLGVSSSDEVIMTPLPNLLVERVTSGIFYDLIDGGGAVRNEYAERFEAYCFDLLSRALSSFSWQREYRYGRKGFHVSTPDVIGYEAEKVVFAIECKSTRMSQEAMFGDNPFSDRGYGELVKGVFQIWRFFSDCRQRKLEVEVGSQAVGVVLTLDSWLVLSEKLRANVIKSAEEMAREKGLMLTDRDRVPVVFVSVSELEESLGKSPEHMFRNALLCCNSEEFNGWRLNDVVRSKMEGEERVKRPFFFSKDIVGILPWLETGVS